MTWHRRIELARKSGRFLAEDRELAGEWVTCACGEQDARIPRLDDGRFGKTYAPVDRTLFELGCKFDRAVEADDFDAAESTLDKIETRAGEILAELTPAEARR